MDIPFCAWCALHNEATWLVEVRTPDEVLEQRLLACSDHSKELFELMDELEIPANYSILRRYMPSDAILQFGNLDSEAL